MAQGSSELGVAEWFSPWANALLAELLPQIEDFLKI